MNLSSSRQYPLGLAAHGSDFVGPLTQWDWHVDFTHAEVQEVYAWLEKRDIHIYSPGLANSKEYQMLNQALLERILGLSVRRVYNRSANELGSRMRGSGSRILRGGGRVVEPTGTLVDWVKTPFLV